MKRYVACATVLLLASMLGSFNLLASASRADFGGDGRSDILWRNRSSGENYVYPMNGTQILAGEGYLRTVPDLNWVVAGLGDFNGDGRADILWRNSASGENYLYLMNGRGIANEGYLRTVAGQIWQVAGTGDFDGDGNADILWRNSASGENYLYLMNGLSIVKEGYVRTVADTSWEVKGIGDFNGDGRADILWRHATGQNYVYLMNGLSIANEGYLRTVADTAWQVKGVADLNGDGRADILWRHAANGENYVYLMNGTSIASEGYVRTVANLNWRIVALGDYDGDGKTDILWRNASNGENYLYPMDGTSIKPSEGYVRSVPPGAWAIVGGPEDGGGGLPSAGARVEESDAAVTFSDGWSQSNSRWGWSGGAAMESTVAGATASFTFIGTSVRWIGRRNKQGGIALVRVDGGPAREVDLSAKPNEIRTSVVTIYDLTPGQHTLTIEVTARPNGDGLSNLVTVDAFEVDPPIVSHLQETDPDVVLSAGWIQDPSSSWSGGGVATLPDPVVGGMRFAETAGERATLTFRGTSIAWSGYRGPDAGIALVKLDGVASEVDTYSSAQKFQEVVFTATGLSDTTHTLTIEVTGRKNDASTGTRIVVDAFDVTTPGRRFEEGDARITYIGPWIRHNVNRSWSEGAANTTNTLGARATFSFTGTSVSWIGCQKSSIARAKVYLDGVLVAEIRNSKPVPIEGYQHTIFRKDGLIDGPHTLTVEASSSGFIVVDAFDVHP